MKNLKDFQDSYKSEGISIALIKDMANFYKIEPKYILDTFICMEVFNTYSYLFKKENTDKVDDNTRFNLGKGKLYTGYSSTVSLDRSIIGSSMFHEMLKLLKILKVEDSTIKYENRINPVYYISSLFDRCAFLNKNANKKARYVPDEKMLMDISIYMTTKNYNSSYFHKENTVDHKAIRYINESEFLYYAYRYFELGADYNKLIAELKASYNTKVATLASDSFMMNQPYMKTSKLMKNLGKHFLASNGEDIYYCLFYGLRDVTTIFTKYALEINSHNSYNDLGLISIYYGYDYMEKHCYVSDSETSYIVKDKNDKEIDMSSDHDLYLFKHALLSSFDYKDILLVRKYLNLILPYNNKLLTSDDIKSRLSKPVEDLTLSKDIEKNFNYFKPVGGNY